MKQVKAFFTKLFNLIVTQDFALEGFDNGGFDIPFTSCDVWFNGLRPIIRYRGKIWEENRNQHVIKLHGMTWEEVIDPKNAHKFVAKTRLMTPEEIKERNRKETTKLLYAFGSIMILFLLLLNLYLDQLS